MIDDRYMTGPGSLVVRGGKTPQGPYRWDEVTRTAFVNSRGCEQKHIGNGFHVSTPDTSETET
jgi:hypothetical protein